MTIHHAPKTLSSHQAAIELIPDTARMGSFLDGLFAERDRRAAEMARIREESRLRDYEEAAEREFGLVKPAMKSAKFWREEFRKDRYKASIGFTQLMVIAQLEKWHESVEPPQDETPVMDRTRTAQRMRGTTFTRDGSRPSYGATQITARQREIEAAASRCLEKLRMGVPPERLREGEGAGRPSSAWEEGRQMALAQFEAEISQGEQQAAE